MQFAVLQCCKAVCVTNVTQKHAGSILRAQVVSHAHVDLIFRAGDILEQTPNSIYRI
jgi:hypothetical protein